MGQNKSLLPLELPKANEIPGIAARFYQKDKSKVTTDEIGAVVKMIYPVPYLLDKYTLKKKPITFTIPNRDERFAFGHRPWQIAIINDTSRYKVIIKSRQLGLSEIGVAEMLWFADRYRANSVSTMYTFPTLNQMNRFVKERLNPVLEFPYFASLVDPAINSLSEKKFGTSFMAFGTSSSDRVFEGQSNDYLCFDEYDRVTASAEESGMQTLSSSKFKVVRKWSTPTTPGYGIDLEFGQTDMKYYEHKCDHCDYWNRMKYADYDPDNLETSGNILLIDEALVDFDSKTVKEGAYDYVCQRCGEHLDRWYNGEWHAQKPEQERSGYMISQMNAVWVSASMLKEKELQAKSKQSFYNYVLGETYQNLDTALTPADIKRGRERGKSNVPRAARGSYDYVAVGIDWGEHYHHIVVMGKKRREQAMEVIALKRVANRNTLTDMDYDINEVIRFLKMYTPDVIMADVGYNGGKVLRLKKEFGDDVVYGIRVSTSKIHNQIDVEFNKNKEVKIDKLTANLNTISDFKAGRINLYKIEDKESKLLQFHWENLIIRDEEDKDGNIVRIITRKKDGDHYAQTMVYAHVAMNELIAGGGKVSFDFSRIALK